MPRPKRKRQHGTGGIYKRGAGWLIKWREGERQRYKTFTDEALARAALNKITHDVEAEGVGLPVERAPVPMLAKLADAWLERRKKTHRSHRYDRSRWNNHCKPAFGKYTPDEVDAAKLRSFIEARLAKKLSAGTVCLLIRLLSTLYTDLVERGLATDNPIRKLPRSTRRLYRSTHDSQQTPFLENLAQVRAVFLILPEPFNVMFAIGTFLGLRPGEILGLGWSDVDFRTLRIRVHQQVQEGKLGPLKDDESRTVMIGKRLLPILTQWKLKTGGNGQLFKPKHPTRGGRKGSPSAFIRPQTLHKALKKALESCKLTKEGRDWYTCTRHTYGSLFVLAGGSMEHLAKLMGHSSVTITERHYCHLRVDLFRVEDYDLFDVDLSPAGEVVPLPQHKSAPSEIGCTVVTGGDARRTKIA